MIINKDYDLRTFTDNLVVSVNKTKDLSTTQKQLILSLVQNWANQALATGNEIITIQENVPDKPQPPIQKESNNGE